MKSNGDKATCSPLVERKLLIPFLLITSCFAWWGLAHNMTDTLLAAFKRIMSLSDFQTSWIQIAFYGSYFCLALPAALFIRRFTYKAGVLLGLGLFIAGALLFYPASKTMNYYHFLLALYILAGGLSILETSANPYVIVMGDPSTATRRLNLAQSFNPVGSIAGVIISQLFILSQLNNASNAERLSMASEQLKEIQSAELSAVMGPYVGVAIILLLLWIVIAFTKMPRAKDETEHANVTQTVKRLLKNKNYLLGVTAQFFYVGAQIGVWSFTIRYVMKQLTVNEKNAATFYLVSLILFALFRFICTALMKYITPGKLLVYLSGIAAILTSVVIVSSGYIGVIALVSISVCMSLMFPTIFGLAVEGLNNDTQIASSGLIMAILGGAVLTALQGLLSDLTSNINLAYIITLVCFIIIFNYGLYVIKREKKITIQR